MGWLRKKGRQLRKGIKKLGREIGKAFKSIMKPFAKVFNKFGPLGSMAMMFILPGIGQMMSGWGAGFAKGGSFLSKFAGKVVQHVGNAINFVATAPQKIFKTITSGMSAGWNSLLGRDPTGLNVNQMLETMDPSVVSDVVKEAGAPTSWWQNFTNDVKSAWTSKGVVAKVDDPGGLFKKDQLVGKGNFWDVSEQGQARIANFGVDLSDMGGDIKRVFKKDPNAITLDDASVKGGDFYNQFLDKNNNFNQAGFDEALKNLKDKGFYKKYTLDRTGVFGNIKDVTSAIGDVTVPGVGELGDVASVGSMALGAYSTAAQYGLVGSDDPVRGRSGFGARAEEQLYSGDQGGIYNLSAPTWSYDSGASLFQNQNNAINSWNNNYGLPQGFDPYATPGYGVNYERWLEQQLTA